MTPDCRSIIPECRSDLIWLADKNVPRRWTLIDAISGRITRLRRLDWGRLQAANACDDCELLSQAEAAGLLRRRTSSPKASRVWPLRLLAFRIPLVQADPLARWLADRSAALFSLPAVFIWLWLASIAATSVLVGWHRVQISLGQLYESTGSAAGLGTATAIVFVLTKCLHELAHAAACRRMGAPVGDLGLYFFCAMPCPYCDVSQVWRNDSRLQRAAVMMAGVYAELVLASLATLVWWLTSSGTAHLIAMNVMVVSGISAIVFNANALMKLDAYYVLSDAVGSTNLKRQAALAWSTLVMTRIAGIAQGRAAMTYANGALSLYHALSTAYRWMVASVILTFLMTLLNEWNLWWVGVTMISTLIFMLLFRIARRWARMTLGQGFWSLSSRTRRLSLSAITLVILLAASWLPVRREVRATGHIDLADAVEVFVPESAWVEDVQHEFGDRVDAGEPLVHFANDELSIQLVSAKSKRTLATLESTHLKREALQKDGVDASWKLDRANRDLVEAQLETLANRQARLQVIAPRHGIVLPIPPRGSAATPTTLLDRQGTFVAENAAWCRVGDPTHTCMMLRVTAEQRQQLRVGDPAQVIIDDGSIRRLDASIHSIDEISQQHRIEGDDAGYLVKCFFAAKTFDSQSYIPLGHDAEARIWIDSEPVWKWLRRKISESLRG